MADDLARIKQRFQELGTRTQSRPLRTRATLVAVDGNVKVPGMESFCYARIHGIDASSIQLVLNAGAPAQEGLAVELEMERIAHSWQYKVVGVWTGAADSDPTPIVPDLPLHSETHERRTGLFGSDYINVYDRMLVPGRVDQTTPASMSVYINYMNYQWSGALRRFDGATTSTLTAPSSGRQYVLVYFIPSQNTYGLRYGSPGASPYEPGVGEGECALASILLTASSTTIADSMIFDRRDWLTMHALEATGGGGDVITNTYYDIVDQTTIEKTVIIEASDADIVHRRLRASLPIMV